MSKDGVDALRKRADVKMKKVESVRQAKKAGWEIEVDKLVSGACCASEHWPMLRYILSDRPR